jgi:hypothetical protein
MKRRLFCFVHFIALMLAVVTTSSASWSQSATGSAADAESSRSAPKVASADSASSPEIQRLERAFGGTWMDSESFARNEFYPSGAERQGTASFTLATGGTSLIEEVHSNGSAGRLDFMVVIWWDNEAKVYNFFTCGNTGSKPCKIRGTAHWDGDSFVNDYDLTIRGAKKKWRDTFTEITPKSFTLIAAMESSDGKAMQPMITATYRRN